MLNENGEAYVGEVTFRGIARISVRWRPNFQGAPGQPLQKRKCHRIWPIFLNGTHFDKIKYFFKKIKILTSGGPIFLGDPMWPLSKTEQPTGVDPLFRGAWFAKLKIFSKTKDGTHQGCMALKAPTLATPLTHFTPGDNLSYVFIVVGTRGSSAAPPALGGGGNTPQLWRENGLKN